MADTRQAFQNVQYEFTAHIRNPHKNPAPAGIEDRRMEVYRGLLYRNVEGFIANGFPVIRKLYNDQDWHSMLRDFFSNHQSHSPYFKDISREFIDYLNHERQARPEDPPFLTELAHYEWLEIMLNFLDVEIDWRQINKNGNLADGAPVLSPLAQLHCYQYPVQKISPEFQPRRPAEQATFLLVYRDQKDAVGFMELNAMSAHLVELVAANETGSGACLLKNLAAEMPHIGAQAILHGGHTILNQLRAKDIILGTKIAR